MERNNIVPALTRVSFVSGIRAILAFYFHGKLNLEVDSLVLFSDVL